MGPHRAGQRAGRSHQRAGARLSLFRSVARRSRRRRRRDADAARRSFAAGAPRARRRAGGKPERAAGDRDRARRRSAADRGAGLCAVAVIRRCRSGRCGGDRRAPRCRRRSPAAPRCRARSPRPSPKSARRNPACCWWKIATPISRRSRSIASSSGSAISRRSAKSLLARDDVPAATRQTLVIKLSETLAGFVARPRLARCRSRPAHRARGLREGDGDDRRGHAGDRASPAHPAFVRERAAHRRPHPARAVVRQYRVVRGSAGRADRHAGRARVGPGSRPRQRRLAGVVRQGRDCRLRPIRPSRKRSRRCARASSASRAAPRGSSGA